VLSAKLDQLYADGGRSPIIPALENELGKINQQLELQAQEAGEPTEFRTPEQQRSGGISAKFMPERPAEQEPTIGEKTEISPKIDADYMKAVDSGDVEAQQKFVDEKMYNIPEHTTEYRKILNGWEISVYGSDDFKNPKVTGQITSKPDSILINTIEATPESKGKGFGKALYLEIARFAQESGQEKISGSASEEAINVRKSLFPTSVVKNDDLIDALSYISPNIKYIPKSFKPSYDDAGNVIQLSQRFNPKTSDIRFMPSEGEELFGKPSEEFIEQNEKKTYWDIKNADGEISISKTIPWDEELNKAIGNPKYIVTYSKSEDGRSEEYQFNNASDAIEEVASIIKNKESLKENKKQVESVIENLTGNYSLNSKFFDSAKIEKIGSSSKSTSEYYRLTMHIKPEYQDIANKQKGKWNKGNVDGDEVSYRIRFADHEDKGGGPSNDFTVLTRDYSDQKYSRLGIEDSYGLMAKSIENGDLWNEISSHFNDKITANKPVAGELPTKQPLSGIQFMPAESAKKPKTAKKEPKKKKEVEKQYITIDAGNDETVSVLQEIRNGKPLTDPKGDPKFVQQKYELLASPFIDNYSGNNPEDTTKPNYDELAYDVSGVAQKKINAAIDSGAVDAAANIMVSKTNEAMKNADIAAGSGWYSRMRENLLNALGVEGRELLSQLLGATSAKTPVNENFLQAMDGYEGMKSGRYDSNRKAYLEMINAENKNELNDLIDDRNYIAVIKNKISDLNKAAKESTGKKQKVIQSEAKKLKELIAIKPEDRTKKNRFSIVINASGLMPLRSNGKKFNANSMAVMKVIAGTWLDNRKAPKTPNFAGNLSGRTVQATIDVWAARFMRQILHEGFGTPWRIQPKSETGVTNEDFALGQVVMQRAAKKLGMNPDDLQAILWFAEKHNWDNRGWTGAEGAEKSSFDEIFSVFFPKGKKPLTFSEASEVLKSQKNKDESIDEQIDEETDGDTDEE
jgi:hypothetical protein